MNQIAFPTSSPLSFAFPRTAIILSVVLACTPLDAQEPVKPAPLLPAPIQAAPSKPQQELRQVVIRAHVFRQSIATLEKLPLDWSYVEAASSIAEAADRGDVQLASHEGRNQHMTLAGWFQELRKNKQPPQDSPPLPPPAGVTSATWSEAVSITERATPVLYTLLTDKQVEQVLAAAEASEDVDTVMRPQLMVYSGQTATADDSTQRPFVTGVNPVHLLSGEKSQVGFAPKVRVYSEGTRMQMRPELIDGERIRLSYHLKLCKIQKVRTLRLPAIAGHEHLSVQLPEVTSTEFRTSMDLPVDHALAICTQDADAQGIEQSTLVLCHCSVRKIQHPEKETPRPAGQ